MGAPNPPATGRALSALTTPPLCQSVATAPTTARTTTGRRPNAPSALGAIPLASTVYAPRYRTAEAAQPVRRPDAAPEAAVMPRRCRAGALFGAPAPWRTTRATSYGR